MYPAHPLHMIGFLAVLIAGSYGAGAVLCLLARLELRTAVARGGVACALGSVLLSWLGYVASVAGLPWLPAVAAWLAVAAAAAVLVRGRLRPAGEPDEPLGRGAGLYLLGAVAVGLLVAAGMDYWQLQYLPDGSLSGRFIWPDTLYRNAVMARLLNCDGAPQWPWLAGVPMKGMSVLRFTAMVPALKATGVAATQYQAASLWVGLYGVPVAAAALFAFYRALGAPSRPAALAVLLTGFLGNPRWLLNERFAHSPALHWAGADVFAISVPVLFAMLALLVLALRERHGGALGLAAFMVVSGMGHVPYKGLAVYAGLGLWLLVALVRRQEVRAAVVLAASALAGVVVLKVLMGSGTAGGSSPLEALGPSPTIRALNWAFPFLGEPLQPLLARLGPTSLMKLLKFGAVYLVAAGFYLAGSMWVRMILAWNAFRFRRAWLAGPEGALLACITISAVLLSTVVNFNRLAYQGAQYDAFRLLWVPLLLANLGVAALAVMHGAWLRRGPGLLLALLLVLYGSWENTQIIVWSRLTLPRTVVSGADLAALRYLDRHAGCQETVLINPRYQAPRLADASREPVQHGWGYYSGLLNAPVYLDNEDMARKFGQAEIWASRLAQLRQAMADGRQWAAFLQANHIRWVVLQGADRLPAGAPALPEVFRQDQVRVYQVP